MPRVIRPKRRHRGAPRGSARVLDRLRPQFCQGICGTRLCRGRGLHRARTHRIPIRALSARRRGGARRDRLDRQAAAGATAAWRWSARAIAASPPGPLQRIRRRRSRPSRPPRRRARHRFPMDGQYFRELRVSMVLQVHQGILRSRPAFADDAIWRALNRSGTGAGVVTGTSGVFRQAQSDLHPLAESPEL